MSYHNTGQSIKPKNSRLGLIIVVGTLAVLLLILGTVIGIIFFTGQFGSAQSNQPNPLTGTRPLSQLEVDDVDPALALASLGGVSEADVIAEAIDKARPETALATLLFHSSLSNKESAGGFLHLAEGYVREGKTDKAVFSYEMAGKVATLAPDIPDTVRADVFLQVSEGLIGLQMPVLAEFYLNQAFVVASKSPFLQAAHRRSIFQQLQKNYIVIENRELARQSLSLAANAPNPTQAVVEPRIIPDNRTVPLPASVQEAEANRWRAAQELAILLVERGGRAPQKSIDALTEALIVEDQQKLSFYKRELSKITQLSKKIDFTIVQIAWLSIKYRVARRAYGLSLVPEWEAQAELIRADLTKTYEDLFALYADLVVALPEASKIDKAAEERLRSEVLAGELGRYPNYPEEQRRRQLLSASEQLMKTQPEINIFVAIGAVQNEERYTLISLE